VIELTDDAEQGRQTFESLVARVVARPLEEVRKSVSDAVAQSTRETGKILDDLVGEIEDGLQSQSGAAKEAARQTHARIERLTALVEELKTQSELLKAQSEVLKAQGEELKAQAADTATRQDALGAWVPEIIRRTRHAMLLTAGGFALLFLSVLALLLVVILR
jgi:hypothetical protein